MDYDAELREVRGPAGVVSLPRQQGDMLDLFLRRAGRLVSRDTLMSALYDDRLGEPPNDKALDVALHRLRARLKLAGVNDHLQSVRSAGWVWRPPASRSTNEG